jgi:hypothetical protein
LLVIVELKVKSMPLSPERRLPVSVIQIAVLSDLGDTSQAKEYQETRG